MSLQILDEVRVERWLADAPIISTAVLRFLRRFVPSVYADAAAALERGGRIRIGVDISGGQVSRLRVRLLRPDPDDGPNKTLYSWAPAAE